MAVKKLNGHAVTGVFPTGSADLTVVAPANVKFPQAPGTQSGGNGGPAPSKKARGTTKAVIR